MVIKDRKDTAKQLARSDWGPVKQRCPNYCKSGIMSHCGAGSDWRNQKKCRFYQKSTIRDRCMHYIEALDGHCDSMQAQRESKATLCRSEDNFRFNALDEEDCVIHIGDSKEIA